MERRGNRYTRHNELNLSAKPHGAAIDVYFGLGKSDLVEVLPALMLSRQPRITSTEAKKDAGML